MIISKDLFIFGEQLLANLIESGSENLSTSDSIVYGIVDTDQHHHQQLLKIENEKEDIINISPTDTTIRVAAVTEEDELAVTTEVGDPTKQHLLVEKVVPRIVVKGGRTGGGGGTIVAPPPAPPPLGTVEINMGKVVLGANTRFVFV